MRLLLRVSLVLVLCLVLAAGGQGRSNKNFKLDDRFQKTEFPQRFARKPAKDRLSNQVKNQRAHKARMGVSGGGKRKGREKDEF
jgi:hypothetical protein